MTSHKECFHPRTKAARARCRRERRRDQTDLVVTNALSLLKTARRTWEPGKKLSLEDLDEMADLLGFHTYDVNLAYELVHKKAEEQDAYHLLGEDFIVP